MRKKDRKTVWKGGIKIRINQQSSSKGKEKKEKEKTRECQGSYIDSSLEWSRSKAKKTDISVCNWLR